jgi:hypothetical protein
VPLVAHGFEDALEDFEREGFVIDEHNAPAIQSGPVNGKRGHIPISIFKGTAVRSACDMGVSEGLRRGLRGIRWERITDS